MVCGDETATGAAMAVKARARETRATRVLRNILMLDGSIIFRERQVETSKECMPLSGCVD